MSLANTLPELQAAERQLRDQCLGRYGIVYVIREGKPHFAGLRTPDTTALLLKWRDEAVATARKNAEKKRRGEGGTAVQINAAGDVAAQRAHYRVSPFGVGKHGVGAAFDIAITDPGTNSRVTTARRSAEATRRSQGGSAVQILEAGKVAAGREAYKLAGELAPAIGLKWGGMFKDNPSTPVVEQPDPYHFELLDPRDVLEKRFAVLAPATSSALTRPGRTTSVVLVGVVLAAIALAIAAGGSSR